MKCIFCNSELLLKEKIPGYLICHSYKCEHEEPYFDCWVDILVEDNKRRVGSCSLFIKDKSSYYQIIQNYNSNYTSFYFLDNTKNQFAWHQTLMLKSEKLITLAEIEDSQLLMNKFKKLKELATFA